MSEWKKKIQCRNPIHTAKYRESKNSQRDRVASNIRTYTYHSCSQNTLSFACSLSRSPKIQKKKKRNSFRTVSLLTGVRAMHFSKTGFVCRAVASLLSFFYSFFIELISFTLGVRVCDGDEWFFEGKRPYIIIVHAYMFDVLTPLSLLFSSLVCQRTAHSQYWTWMRACSVCTCVWI